MVAGLAISLTTIALNGARSSQGYPAHLCRVRFSDLETRKALASLTNQTGLPTLTVGKLRESRWQVEFFMWIKQHRRITRFSGTSEYAVKPQIWIAVSVYVLAGIVRKHPEIEASLCTSMQVFSVAVFEKMPMKYGISSQSLRFRYRHRT